MEQQNSLIYDSHYNIPRKYDLLLLVPYKGTYHILLNGIHIRYIYIYIYIYIYLYIYIYIYIYVHITKVIGNYLISAGNSLWDSDYIHNLHIKQMI